MSWSWMCPGYRQFWHCALTTCSLPWMQIVFLATGKRYRDSHLFLDTQKVCRGYTHCVLVRGRVFRIQAVCSGYRPLIQADCPRNRQYVLYSGNLYCIHYTVQAMCHEQAMYPRYRLCVLDTIIVFEIQAVWTICRQCVLDTSSVSFVQTVCLGYRQCVLDTGSISLLQAVYF